MGGDLEEKAVMDEPRLTTGLPQSIRRRRLALVVVLCVAAMVAVAQAPSPAKPVSEVLDELEEVVVHGRQLKDEIVKAEDKYFALFNEVNKDDRYDTHCVSLQMDRESRLQTRACIPGFVADALADWAPFKARCQPPQEGAGFDEFSCLDRSKDGRISQQEAEARGELGVAFRDLDKDGGADGYLNRMEFTASCSDCDPAKIPSQESVYMPPTPDVVLMNGSAKWYQHMLEVTKSDPRLKKMADELGGMYEQLTAAQRRINELDAQAKPKTGKFSTGPRGR
jgi:hypothetical protein